MFGGVIACCLCFIAIIVVIVLVAAAAELLADQCKLKYDDCIETKTGSKKIAYRVYDISNTDNSQYRLFRTDEVDANIDIFEKEAKKLNGAIGFNGGYVPKTGKKVECNGTSCHTRGGVVATLEIQKSAYSSNASFRN